ncbi:MAG: hypothetical protein M0P95_01455 [Sulfuritalea sp.]|jgi:hypothetical protein|nr:hypothetical protein [Sulfuritalea sp.]
MHSGWVCAALSTLTLLPSASAVAAPPDPVLRRSEQLDTRRLGKVSEEERSVLRVEWRAAATGADEARTVQNMLDSLRHMEESVGDVSRLIGSMPVQRPVAAVAAAEPAESGDFNSRLALANITAAALVALWWFRRRNPANHPETNATPNASRDAAPRAAASPVASLPPLAAPVADLLPEEQRREPTEAIKAAPPPTPVTGPAVEQTAPPKATETSPSAPLPATATPAIDFSLEEADPEVVARENAKLTRLKTAPAPAAPAKSQETNVEPTLQLAEIMLSMGLEQGAAQALVDYTEANPRHAVYHWLKLLSIYRSKGLLKEYKETAEKLRQHFNIQAEDSPASGPAPMLESFSRVAQHVEEIWQQPAECLAYLQHLLEDNREGSRAGFPLSVAEEILWLIEIRKVREA